MYNIIPTSNPYSNYLKYKKSIDFSIKKVLSSGIYISGNECSYFEEDFAKFIGSKFAIGVASGTDAIAIALSACGIGPGDEVITTSHSAVATAAAIVQIGAIPIFVDIDPKSRCICPEAFRKAISPTTKAVVPVHIYGQPADVVTICSIARLFGIKVIEDCAQAHGATIQGQTVGTFGDAAAFSFYPTKNLGALGDGGAITTNSTQIAETCHLLREYGWKERHISTIAGRNSRLDEIQAAILRIKLLYLKEDNAKRKEIAKNYTHFCDGKIIAPPREICGTEHSMHLYVIELNERIKFKNFMHQHGIMTAFHYPLPIHKQPAYNKNKYKKWPLKETENLYSKIITLPMFPELKKYEIKKICHAILEWEKLNKKK